MTTYRKRSDTTWLFVGGRGRVRNGDLVRGDFAADSALLEAVEEVVEKKLVEGVDHHVVGKARAKIVSAAAQEIALEIDREIIQDLFQASKDERMSEDEGEMDTGEELEESFPIEGFDDMNYRSAMDSVVALDDVTDLCTVREHELANKARKSVLSAIEGRLAELE